ncbi:MAG: hypothetical protein ACOVP8_09635 [Phycisphaerales bacterium]|jgi:hypothetical protein
MRQSPILAGVFDSPSRFQPTGFAYTDPLLHDEMEAIWRESERIEAQNQSKPFHQWKRPPSWSHIASQPVTGRRTDPK